MARLRPRGVGVQSRSIVIDGAEVRLARFDERLGARVIDAAILLACEGIVVVAVFLPLSLMGWGHDWGGLFHGRLGETVDALVWVLPVSIAFMWLMYETVSTASGSRTVGKRGTGIAVVKAADGAPPSLLASFGRALAPLLAGVGGAALSWRLGVWTPFESGAALWAFVYLSAIWSRRRQGWHDMLAGTVVVGPQHDASNPPPPRSRTPTSACSSGLS